MSVSAISHHFTNHKGSTAKPNLSICDRQLGADHPDVASSLFNLAALYHNTQRYSQALQSIQRAIQITLVN